jgi:ADP-L-glycero-D-manno-heptose 6-epimerase
MKILVTGHKGFIGSNLVNALTDHEVTTFEWGESWPTVKGLDWVMHIGAISSTTEQNRRKILQQNYEFSIWLFEECKHHNINMQYSSSASVYGLGTEFAETSVLDPRTLYAESKMLFEHYANKYTHGNIVQGFRYFNVYGPGEEHKGSQASPFCQFKKQAEQYGEIKVFENSEEYYRDFVPVSEVVNTHLKFLKVKESGIWNVGTGTAQSFLDVAKSFNVPISTIPMPDILKNSYQKYTCADVKKLKETLDKYA